MKHSLVFLFLFFCAHVGGQEPESDLDAEFDKLTPFIQALRDFTKYVPQEKVYLHFDNTSYY